MCTQSVWPKRGAAKSDARDDGWRGRAQENRSPPELSPDAIRAGDERMEGGFLRTRAFRRGSMHPTCYLLRLHLRRADCRRPSALLSPLIPGAPKARPGIWTSGAGDPGSAYRRPGRAGVERYLCTSQSQQDGEVPCWTPRSSRSATAGEKIGAALPAIPRVYPEDLALALSVSVRGGI